MVYEDQCITRMLKEAEKTNQGPCPRLGLGMQKVLGLGAGAEVLGKVCYFSLHICYIYACYRYVYLRVSSLLIQTCTTCLDECMIEIPTITNKCSGADYHHSNHVRLPADLHTSMATCE